MHISGMNFAGPGTNLDERLTFTDAYKEWSKPIDRVDNAAYHHDLPYKYINGTAKRNLADKIMIKETIENPTIRERIERGIIKPIISTKAKFGLGSLNPYELGIETKTTQKNYKRSYGWIVPLKSKTGVVVANALNKIFKERKCQKMWVDKGLEFYNKHVKALGIELYSTENEEKSCEVERWNRTMKDKMFKYFSANSTRKYINVLDEIVNKYNNTKHSSIKKTPVEANDKRMKILFG
ncbi:uncharacterized protein LOC136083559 [Hydra vulgaris]|uniref:Uncharacterized protein LOC136083559 n=1 Tax=Hydra vulgaris TaxID=6087 RepID=A0ABM4CBJ1_HYDVU